MRYRYGVFPEVGFHNDPKYPEYYQVGPELRRNEGCNTTFIGEEKDKFPSNGTSTYVRQMVSIAAAAIVSFAKSDNGF